MLEQYILLVEDNANDIALTERALKKAGFTEGLVVAEDGAEALDYLFGRGKFAGRDTSHLPRVILLDLKLPKLDGHEVLKQIRANYVTGLVPIVILTSSKEERDLFNSYSLGANSYIRKPVSFTEFTDTVKQLGTYWLRINEPPPDMVRSAA